MGRDRMGWDGMGWDGGRQLDLSVSLRGRAGSSPILFVRRGAAAVELEEVGTRRDGSGAGFIACSGFVLVVAVARLGVSLGCF